MPSHRIAVFGASNVDLTATPYTAIAMQDSNPGQVRSSMGGVGRNIAENLRRLDQRVSFVSAFGDDSFSRLLIESLRDLDIDIKHCLTLPDTRGSLYFCLNDERGDMLVAVNDMDLFEHIGPDFMRKQAEALRESDAFVVEANLPDAALAGLSEVASLPPMFADTVSAFKAKRLLPVLPRLTGIKTNGIEAKCLTGIDVTDRASALRTIGALHQMGPEWVMLTLGAEGAILSDGKRIVSGKLPIKNLVNTTGCGDAFIAGAVYAYLSCATPENVLQCGLSCAAGCARSSLSVSPDSSEASLRVGLEEIEMEVIA